MKLKPLALGTAIGILWGGCIFLTTFLAVYTGYGDHFLRSLPLSLYPGYTITATGSFLGLIYGFADGFISGVIVAWLYNRISK